jgi:hypothetical protein
MSRRNPLATPTQAVTLASQEADLAGVPWYHKRGGKGNSRVPKGKRTRPRDRENLPPRPT